MTGGTRSTRLVPTVTLDSLADQLPAPDVIKVDVEGAEIAVLAGGHRVLSKQALTATARSPARTRRRRAELLIAHGYTLYDGARCPGERAAAAAAPFNTLAIARLRQGG